MLLVYFITFWIQVYLNFQHPSDKIHMALPTQRTHFPAHITYSTHTFPCSHYLLNTHISLLNITTIISIICANVGFTCFW